MFMVERAASLIVSFVIYRMLCDVDDYWKPHENDFIVILYLILRHLYAMTSYGDLVWPWKYVF